MVQPNKTTRPENTDEEAQPNKKAKTGTDAEAVETPYDLWNKEFNEKRQSLDAACIVIRSLKKPGASAEYEEEDDDDEEEIEESEYKKLTREEIDSSFRVIFVKDSRKNAIEEMGKLLLLGEQYGMGMQMFDTSFSLMVLAAWAEVQKRLRRAKQPAGKLEHLVRVHVPD